VDAGAPETTVIIPTRNRWRLATRAVTSALAQLDVELDVIVIDDGSDSAPPDGFAEIDERLRLVRHETARGVSAARNSGIARAAGRWLAFLDDDDVWAPHKLRALLDAASRSGAEFAYSDAVVVDHGLRPLAYQRAVGPDALRCALRSGNAVPGGGSNVIADARLIARCGGFDTGLSYGADWELWLRLSAAARAEAVAEPLVAYTVHAGGVPRHWARSVFADLSLIESVHPDVAVDRRTYARHVAYREHLAGRRGSAVRAYAHAAATKRDARSIGGGLRALLGRRIAIRLGLEHPPPESPEWIRSRRAAR
jgi:glycosyltransferase involved in cell wall biosynthesis